eukprot:gene29916-biopygen11671
MQSQIIDPTIDSYRKKQIRKYILASVVVTTVMIVALLQITAPGMKGQRFTQATAFSVVAILYMDLCWLMCVLRVWVSKDSKLVHALYVVHVGMGKIATLNKRLSSIDGGEASAVASLLKRVIEAHYTVISVTTQMHERASTIAVTSIAIAGVIYIAFGNIEKKRSHMEKQQTNITPPERHLMVQQESIPFLNKQRGGTHADVYISARYTPTLLRRCGAPDVVVKLASNEGGIDPIDVAVHEGGYFRDPIVRCEFYENYKDGRMNIKASEMGDNNVGAQHLEQFQPPPQSPQPGEDSLDMHSSKTFGSYFDIETVREKVRARYAERHNIWVCAFGEGSQETILFDALKCAAFRNRFFSHTPDMLVFDNESVRRHHVYAASRKGHTKALRG